MNGPSVKAAAKITAEERALLLNYRQIGRWDRTFIFMILKSLAFGKLGPATDRYSWARIRAISDMPRSGKAAHHG